MHTCLVCVWNVHVSATQALSIYNTGPLLTTHRYLQHLSWKVLAIVDTSVHGYEGFNTRLRINRARDDLGPKPYVEGFKNTQLALTFCFTLGLCRLVLSMIIEKLRM